MNDDPFWRVRVALTKLSEETQFRLGCVFASAADDRERHDRMLRLFNVIVPDEHEPLRQVLEGAEHFWHAQLNSRGAWFDLHAGWQYELSRRMFLLRASAADRGGWKPDHAANARSLRADYGTWYALQFHDVDWLAQQEVLGSRRIISPGNAETYLGTVLTAAGYRPVPSLDADWDPAATALLIAPADDSAEQRERAVASLQTFRDRDGKVVIRIALAEPEGRERELLDEWHYAHGVQRTLLPGPFGVPRMSVCWRAGAAPYRADAGRA